jgi:hypothetical protein
MARFAGCVRPHERRPLSPRADPPSERTGKRQPIGKDWFDKFGGATSFLRAPGQGLWQSGGGKEKDSIAVVEVMAKRLDPS